MISLSTDKSLSEKICERILFLTLDSDEQVITENNLCRDFGLSRVSIRDRLKELEVKGIIERKKKKGITLKKITREEIIEIYDIRYLLEGLACKVAASKHHTDKDYADLEKLVQHFEEAYENHDETAKIELDSLFHRKIIELSDYSLMLQMVDGLLLFQKSFTLAFRLQEQVSLSQRNPFSHRNIFNAIKTNAPDQAEQTMHSHLKWGKENLLNRTVYGNKGNNI